MENASQKRGIFNVYSFLNFSKLLNVSPCFQQGKQGKLTLV